MTAGVLDGKATSWHDNGQLESEKLYVDNNIHGKWIEWYENGQKKEELNYNYGEPDGSQTSWEMNGDESNKTIYKNGKITHMYYRGYLTVSPPEIAGLNK